MDELIDTSNVIVKKIRKLLKIPTNVVTREELAYLHARISAVEQLSIAMANQAPEIDKIREMFVIYTEERRQGLMKYTPLTEARIAMQMRPFLEIINNLNAAK